MNDGEPPARTEACLRVYRRHSNHRETEEEHLQTLNEVPTRLENAGVWLKKNKCVFMADEVVYLGHRTTRRGCSQLLRRCEQSLTPQQS